MTKTVLPDCLLVKANVLRAPGGRRLPGLCGAPGSGKSTPAAAFKEAFGERAVVVPMDGFHLAQVELERLPRATRKGAPDTFDSADSISLFRRLRAQSVGETVYARPSFARSRNLSRLPCRSFPKLRWSLPKGKPSARRPMGAGPCRAGRVLVCRHDEDKRLAWLLARHVTYGRSLEAAGAWIERRDAPNARVVQATREKADVFVNIAHQERAAAPESLVNIPPKLKAED